MAARPVPTSRPCFAVQPATGWAIDPPSTGNRARTAATTFTSPTMPNSSFGSVHPTRTVPGRPGSVSSSPTRRFEPSRILRPVRPKPGRSPDPEERVRRAWAAYYGIVSELDEYVGQLYDALAAADELEDTVFVYTSDHGELLGEHGLWYKNSPYEGAAHVPLVVSGIGLPAGESVETPVGHVDLVRTLLEWADAGYPDPQRRTSLQPLIEGDADEATGPDDVYAENHSKRNCFGSFMTRKTDWKYIHFTGYDDLLFDLATDQNEFENRADDPEAPDVREELRGDLYEEVDPEVVTRRAFQRQQSIPDEVADRRGTEGLFETLRGRFDAGQPRMLAEKHADG